MANDAASQQPTNPPTANTTPAPEDRSGLVAYLRSVGPAALVSAAFAAGTVWVGLQSKIDAQQAALGDLKATVAALVSKSEVASLQERVLRVETQGEKNEERNRLRISELTQLSERLAALDQRVSERLLNLGNQVSDVRHRVQIDARPNRVVPQDAVRINALPAPPPPRAPVPVSPAAPM